MISARNPHVQKKKLQVSNVKFCHPYDISNFRFNKHFPWFQRITRSSLQGPQLGSLMLRFSKPGVQEALLLLKTVSSNIMILAERENLALDITQ